jgi:hypothetical protein
MNKRFGRNPGRRRIGRRAAALVAVALGMLIGGSAQASGPSSGNKVYDATVKAASGPVAGVSTSYMLTLGNDSSTNSSITLGSADFWAPPGWSLGAVTSTPAGWTVAVQHNVTAPDGSVTDVVTFRATAPLTNGQSIQATVTGTAPCSPSSSLWQTEAKQSNNFSGPPGNDFTPSPSNNTTTTVTGSCTLRWVTEPTSAVVNTTITGSAYSTSGSPVEVQALDGANNPISGPTVTLALAGGTFTGNNCGFTGATAQLDASGDATFPNLQATCISGSSLTLSATAPGLTWPTSSAFNITTSGVPCVAGQPCQLNGQLGNNGLIQITGNGGNFLFIGLDSTGIPASVTTTGGCANFIGTGASFAETDGRSSAGTLTITLSVPNSALKQAYGPNYSQANVPICVGARHLDANQQPISCQTDMANHVAGFPDRVLGTNGQFNGNYGTAVCDADGYWWGIVGTRQDPTALGFDSTVNPLLTAWGAVNGTNRSFTLSVPANWDMSGGC